MREALQAYVRHDVASIQYVRRIQLVYRGDLLTRPHVSQEVAELYPDMTRVYDEVMPQ